MVEEYLAEYWNSIQLKEEVREIEWQLRRCAEVQYTYIMHKVSQALVLSLANRRTGEPIETTIIRCAWCK